MPDKAETYACHISAPSLKESRYILIMQYYGYNNKYASNANAAISKYWLLVNIYVPAAKGMIGLMLCMICAKAGCNITSLLCK